MRAASPVAAAAAQSKSFSEVDTWVFDLDKTLYPIESSLWLQIDQRIMLYVMELAGLDGISARALQKDYYRQYGTTLRGLMAEYGIDPVPFLDFCHDIDRSDLIADPMLGEAIARLPGRKLIMTNGSSRHAEATAEKLGILHHFEGIFDVVAADYLPKPEMATYERFFERHLIDPKRAAMFEDLEKNLVPAHHHGMRTILIVPKSGGPDAREAFERTAVAPTYIDFITDDLTGFLTSIPV